MLHLFFLSLALTLSISPNPCHANAEVSVLMAIKSSLDPENKVLTSWTESGDPCSANSFLGVACNEYLKVANISLQGKGLTGTLPPSITGLKCLSGLYLHYNFLTGEIPKQISGLTELSELYLNVNNLTGEIPVEIGNMTGLQVVELCCNQLNGSIPSEVGNLKKLNVLALQHNQLTGQIPRTLGGLAMLERLDLSFNKLLGSIPINIAKLSKLEFFDVQNNNLSGFIPTGLKRLGNGFGYKNNRDLCGVAFPSLRPCTDLDVAMVNQLEPFTPTPETTLPQNIPQSASIMPHCHQINCTNSSNLKKVGIIAAIVAVIAALTVTAFVTLFVYRRRKQKIWSKSDTPDHRFSSQRSSYESGASSCAWDPTQKSPKTCGFCAELDSKSHSLQSFNMEEIESATRYFSDANLLGRSKFSAVYKGVLRDRSVVAIKSVSVTSCKADEAEFTKGLSLLTSLKHENLARLRGFCCSKSRGECFLVYDFASRGNLSHYLDVENGRIGSHVLDWRKKVSIIIGVAKGLAYLHRNDVEKPTMVHRNISIDKILIDEQYNPLITDAGLLKLLADDIVYSALKVSAALGYMAPEYITTGKFTEKSDVYAFGVVVLQILSGQSNLTGSIRAAAAERRFDDFIDQNLEGKFSELEADKLTRIGLICVDENPENRLTMEDVIRELSKSA